MYEEGYIQLYLKTLEIGFYFIELSCHCNLSVQLFIHAYQIKKKKCLRRVR